MLVAAALSVAGLPSPADAGQVNASLTVSVQVIESCTSTAASPGRTDHSCSAQAEPMSVVGGNTEPPDAGPVEVGPFARTADGHLVTVHY
jgi:hypothetical protein